jgi:predicted nuclease with TOPRIM domain
VSRLTKELGRLDQKELDEEAQLEEFQRLQVELQAKVTESQNRLKRLRMQKRSLESKGVEMVNRGLASLDDLESVEEAESSAVVDVMSLGGFGVVDWGVLDFPTFGDTAVVGAGNSASS